MRRFRCTYPDLQIAYLEEPPKEGGDPRIFGPLIGDYSEFIQSKFLCTEGGKFFEGDGGEWKGGR